MLKDNERILTIFFLSLWNTQIHALCRYWDATVSVYYFPTAADDDEDGPTFKERLLECLMKGIDVFCVWDCCWLWLEFQKYVALLVFDPFVELFITLCIVVNTLFMALDHHDMDKDMEKALKSGNYVSLSNVCLRLDLILKYRNIIAFPFSSSRQHSELKRC